MRTSKNSIRVCVRGQTLSLVLPRIYCRSVKRIALGISDNPENRKFAELKAKQIEIDFLSGSFDITLEKYRQKEPTPAAQAKSLTLPEIYEKYVDSRKKNVSPTTWKGYQGHLKQLISCPYQLPEEALKIRDWAVENKPTDTARRLLVQANAACEWAVDRGMLLTNPFKGSAVKIKSKKPKPKISPFTVEEKAAILQAFAESNKFGYMTPLIQFLFLTGCRTSEAIALQWHHVKSDCSSIRFEEAIVFGVGGTVRKKGTKQSEGREFPCNSQLRTLLLSIKPGNAIANTSIFLRPGGLPISRQDLRTAWYGKGRDEGIVKSLAREELMETYRPQYNTRHTFISQCLEAGIPPTQVAEWVGNSAEIIFRNYAGIINKKSVPEF
ncbi:MULTISPECIES: tyrosine-type recombinase/integrase [unclassified Microcoleus]|uniref:site-specific integrase n=1 Tax=unclassified Microcoleus TaxID=2642155 RepID=UPI001E0432DE|nr:MULTISPECIES: tyrosine-type recombinase/integrase [unclassified Microcoleus]MCC3473973.1 tyrosine-type recombinase/integrase [Microcoleus sp. PH2017_13_LAR_U_A]MCC3486056.1 tyrosine-type recombinase/integrase [Microcoleus sp. PH2017_14_LAR_D_A]MCC3598588.1 tyrosine-type recombinase/integrase [Microcoleus sp. PH2017_26_ELK_O_A]MCC3623931.1 tyrosine-type recombinase/integrase [Microcoleus sp. PH2017_36_ELK_O_B]